MARQAAVSNDVAQSGLQAHLTWTDVPPDADEAWELYDGVRWKRVAAYIIDFVIISAAIGFIWVVGTFFVILTFGLLWSALVTLTAIFPLLYHTLLIGGSRSATWGMRAMDIHVRTWNGNAPTMLQAALMTALFYVTIVVTNLLVLLVSLFNPRGRCVHDYFSGTVVINDPA